MLVRIDRDVEPHVVSHAEENSRSIPKEVNHVLRGVYRSAITVLPRTAEEIGVWDGLQEISGRARKVKVQKS